MKIPNEFKRFHGEDEALLLEGTLHWLKHADFCFWRELLKVHVQIGNGRSKAVPFIY